MSNGTILQAKAALVAALANSAEFQTLCAVDDATAAAERIYTNRLPLTSTVGPVDLAPYAMVTTSRDRGFRWNRDSNDQFTAAGALWIQILRTVIDSDTPDDDWDEQVGTIVEEILAQSETAGRLRCRGAELLDIGRGYDDKQTNAPGATTLTRGDDIQVCTVRIDWGFI